MNPALLLIIILALVTIAGFFLLVWGNKDTSNTVFHTKGHKSSEFKMAATGIFIAVTGLWLGTYGINSVGVDERLVMAETVTAFNRACIYAIAAIVCVYTAGRAYIKAHHKGRL